MITYDVMPDGQHFLVRSHWAGHSNAQRDYELASLAGGVARIDQALVLERPPEVIAQYAASHLYAKSRPSSSE